MTVANSSSLKGKALAPGIYCPTMTFFKDTPEQELDIETYSRHLEVLATSGMHGVVVLGSNGEAVATNAAERMELVRVAKEVFARCGNSGAIIAGTGSAQSTRECIEVARYVASAGAEYALVLPPSYYPGALTPAAIQQFYEDVADASPIPLIIYSYPAVSSGIVMDTDLVRKLAKHPNIVGIKHTDHEVGRVARETSIKSYGSPFTVLGGASDYLLGVLAVGGKGAITGMCNVTPRVVAKVYDLYVSGKQAEALELGGVLSRCEWALGKGGLLGTKHAMQWINGYPASASVPRKPLPQCADAVKQYMESELADLVAIEKQLQKEGYAGLGLRPAAKEAANGSSNGSVIDALKQKVAAL